MCGLRISRHFSYDPFVDVSVNSAGASPYDDSMATHKFVIANHNATMNQSMLFATLIMILLKQGLQELWKLNYPVSSSQDLNPSQELQDQLILLP